MEEKYGYLEMDIEYFKDKLFDLLNDADNIGISNIETYDKENIFKILFNMFCASIIKQNELYVSVKMNEILTTANLDFPIIYCLYCVCNFFIIRQ